MTTPTTTTELHPAWDNARTYLTGIKQAVRLSIAGQVLLGMELMSLKKDLGFTHGSQSRFSPSGQSVHLEDSKPRTWSEWVTAELGISYKTADRMIMMWDSARSRIKRIGHTGDLPGGTKKLALICDARPATLSEEDKQKLAAVVEKITDGDTQKDLLAELNLIKKHVPLPGGDTSAHRKDKPSEEEMMGQLAFRFFLPIAEGLQSLRTSPDREAFLHTVPLHSSEAGQISLTSLENDMEAALHDIRAAKKARMKPTTGKVIS